jgi:2-methylcitrate dehydratase PrpD
MQIDDSGNQAVARFITGINWDQLPAEAQHIARLALLDTLGALLVGTQTPIYQVSVDFVDALWPGEAATLPLSGRRASTLGAAFANGNGANAVDIDDVGLYTRGHPGAQVFPTALALAEAGGLSGADLLSALVVGYEVAHRASRIWHATHDVYQACGSWGSVACAAVASHLLRLDPTQTGHALGIADYHAPNLPMMRDIDHPAMVKHGIGWGAMNGIVSAELARRGYTGVPALFGFPPYQGWVADIGQRYIMVGGIAWKQYACCAWDHSALVGIEGLRAAHEFQTADIERVRIETFYNAVRLGIEQPTTTEEAQFNVAWPVAAMLAEGEVGPEQILEGRLADPAIRALAERVEVVEIEALTRLHDLADVGDPAGRYASRVLIVLRDGRTLDSGLVDAQTNFPPICWDPEKLEAKFRWLVGPLLGPVRTDHLVELVGAFEEVDDVRELTALIG